MKKRFKEVLINPLFSGSVVMILGSNFGNLLNYIYHFVMGRLLGPSAYGELAALFSLIGFLGILPASFNLVVVKYISSVRHPDMVRDLLNWLSKKILIFALIVAALIIITSPATSSFLNTTNLLPIVLIGVSFVFMILVMLNRAVLQGLLHFNQMVITLVTESGLKLVLGVVFVLLGFSVGGAVFGLLLAMMFTWFLSKYFVNKVVKQGNGETPQITDLFRYSLPVLIQSTAVTSLYSADVVLVKHFFPPHDAGIYAALSTLGKIIFFAAGPISNVMFPIVAKKHTQGQNSIKIFLYSLVFTSLISGAILLIYELFSEIAVSALFGPSYLEASGLLVRFGLLISFFTISSLIINFYLSVGRTKVVLLPLIAAILQILGIWFYHSDLLTVINVSLVISFLLLLSLGVSLMGLIKTISKEKEEASSLTK